MPKSPATPEIEIAIPPDQLEAIRTSLLELYQVSADALAHDATRHLRAGDAIATVHAHRDELAALDRMLEQAGWPGEPSSGDPVTLAATGARLREVLWLALCRATTELDEACGGYWHGASDVPTLLELSDRVRARLAMLAATLEADDAAPATLA
jgi:hypothetical protein